MNIFRFYGIKMCRTCISESSPTAGRSTIEVGRLKPSHCRHLPPPYLIGEAALGPSSTFSPTSIARSISRSEVSRTAHGDGTVNLLDLVMVANGFGKSAPDPNGDGVVNILDLVFVVQ